MLPPMAMVRVFIFSRLCRISSWCISPLRRPAGAVLPDNGSSKAMSKGIPVDKPFATFFSSQLKRKYNYLNDLPSLDPELYRHPIFVKVGANEPVVSGLLTMLPTTIADLEPHLIRSFYESMLKNLSKQISGGDWIWNNLNTLSWVIGSTSGSLVEEEGGTKSILACHNVSLPTNDIISHHEPGEGPAFFKLALQWPKSTSYPKKCKTSKKPPYCHKVHAIVWPRFSMHSLWPHFANGRPCYQSPKNANYDPSLDYAEIKKLEIPLLIHWRDLKDCRSLEQSINFWRYQWEQHGYYSGYAPMEYFSIALELIDSLCPDLGITIGKPLTVQDALEDIKSVVEKMVIRKKKIGASVLVEIHGRKDQDQQQPHILIEEVRVCLRELRDSSNKVGFEPVDCGIQWSGDCRGLGDSVILLP